MTVLVLERGYPAYWLFATLLQRENAISVCRQTAFLNLSTIRAFSRSGLLGRANRYAAHPLKTGRVRL